MPFNDSERDEVMGSLRRIESKQSEQGEKLASIEDSQERQDDQIAKINRALDDTDENGGNGLKTKVAFVYDTVRSWQDRWQGAKYVFGVIAFVLTSGVGLLVYNLLSVWIRGGAG